MKRFLFITLLTVLSYSLTPASFAVGGSIASHPANPTAGQKVKLRYVTPVTTNVKWDFGDDSNACNAAASAFTHVFTEPGTYTIRAWDTFCDDGVAPTATKTIVIGGSATTETAFEIQSGELLFKNGTQAITVHKNDRGLRAKITFRGEGSGRARLQWLLDGQPFSSQAKKVDFTRQKNITIELNRDLPTQIPGSSHTVSLRIKDPRSPKLKIADISYGVDRAAFGAAAGFGVSYIELRFKNRSAYMNVEKDLRNFKAYADFKCEGSGTLQVQWLVDGKPFFIQSKTVNFAGTVSIDSGRNLPTLVNGSHTVSIRLLSPQTGLKIPVIKYLVGGEPGTEAPKYNVAIKFNSYQDNFGKSNMLSGTTLKAKQGEYLVLNGKVINKGKEAIPKGFMQMYIDGKLMATQAIKLIPPGGLVPFDTSIQFPPEVQKSQVEFRFSDRQGAVIQVAQLHLATDALTEIKPVDLSKLSAPAPEQTSHVPFKILYFSPVNPVVGDYSNNVYVDIKAEGITKAYVSVRYAGGYKDEIPVIPNLDGSIQQTVHIPYKNPATSGRADFDFSHPLTLVVEGKDGSGQKATRFATIYMTRRSIENNSDTEAPVVIKRFEFSIYGVADTGYSSHQGRFRYEFSSPPESYEIRYLEKNKPLASIDDWFWINEFRKNIAPFDVEVKLAKSQKSARTLPGAGAYQLTAIKGGKSSSKIIYIGSDSDLDYFRTKASAMDCDGKIDISRYKAKEKIYTYTYRFEGKGGCDECGHRDESKNNDFYELECSQHSRKHYIWQGKGCIRGKFNCSELKTYPGYTKYLKHIKAGKPIIHFTIPGASNATHEHGHMNYLMVFPGDTVKLSIGVADTPTNTTFQRDMEVKLYSTEIKTGKKKLIQTINYKGGYEKARGMATGDFYNRNDGWLKGDKYTVLEIPVSPSVATRYTVIAENLNGKTSASNSILIRDLKTFALRIGHFNIEADANFKATKFVYDFQHAFGGAEIRDPLNNKVLLRIKTDTTGSASGYYLNMMENTNVLELVVKDAAGKPVRKRATLQRPVPAIDYFDIVQSPGSIKSGDEVVLKYKVQNPIGLIQIIDPIRNKVLERIRPDRRSNISEGASRFKVNATSSFELVLNDGAGGTLRKKIRIVIANDHGAPGTKILPRFHSGVTATKAGSTIKSILPDDAFYLNVKISAADEAFVYEKWSQTRIAELPVFEAGTIGTAKSIIRVPKGFTGDSATFTIILFNSNGSTENDFTIAVDHGLSFSLLKEGKNIASGKNPKKEQHQTGVFERKTTSIDPPLLSANKFWGSSFYVKKGQPVTLHWEIADGTTVASYWKQGSGTKTSIQLKGKGKTKGSIQLTPPFSSKYLLEVKGLNNLFSTYSVDVLVEQPKGTYTKKPVGKLTLSAVELTEGETCKISYELKDAAVAHLTYYDSRQGSDVTFAWLPVEENDVFAKGTAVIKVASHMTAIKLVLSNELGQIIKRKEIKVKAKKAYNAGGKKKKVSYKKTRPAVVDFNVTPKTIQLGAPCYADYEFRFTESAYILNEQTGKKKYITIKRPVTLQNPTKGIFKFYPKQSTTYHLVVENPYDKLDFPDKVVVKGGKPTP